MTQTQIIGHVEVSLENFVVIRTEAAVFNCQFSGSLNKLFHQTIKAGDLVSLVGNLKENYRVEVSSFQKLEEVDHG